MLKLKLTKVHFLKIFFFKEKLKSIFTFVFTLSRTD